MKKLTLEEHIQKSRQAAEANKAKGNRHAEFFSTMYARPYRFIEEILQNTEDAYARKNATDKIKIIRFKLFPDRIEIHHNGKDFDEQDLMSLTTFAYSTKNNLGEVNLIGKFGIGFKSVFSITQHPEIHSGGFHYRIVDYEVLEKTPPQKPDTGLGTLIVLPFKKHQYQQCYDIVKKGLEELNSYNLLFLKQINKIEICEDHVLNKSIEKQAFQDKKFTKINIINKNVKTSNTETYLVFSYFDTKSNVQLAFQTFDDKIVPVYSAPIFVYFPIQLYSGLKFLLHGNFTTNPLRESIPFDEMKAPENMLLLKKTEELFQKTLKILKESGMFHVDLLSILPVSKPVDEDHIVYKTFYEILKKYLSSEKAIPAFGGGYSHAKDVIIAEDAELYDLLTEADVKILFQKKNFADFRIIEEKYQPLKDYFVNTLNIKSIDAKTFALRIMLCSNFIEQKKIKWIVKFYEYLHKYPFLWDKHHSSNYYSLRYYPIILTQHHGVVPAFNKNEKPVVFLPGKVKAHLPVVHHKIAENPNCRTFLTDLGLTEPEPENIIENGIITYLNDFFYEDHQKYVKEIGEIVKHYTTFPPEKQMWLQGLLSHTPWVEAENKNGEKLLKPPAEIYIDNQDLLKFFAHNKEVLFISADFHKTMRKKFGNVFENMLINTGINTFPRWIVDENNKKELEGFDDFLLSVDIKRSKALMKLILRESSKITDEVAQYLSQKKWLFTKSNYYTEPEKVTIDQISENYELTEKQKILFATLLGIKILSNNNVQEALMDWMPSVPPDTIRNEDQKKVNIGDISEKHIPTIKKLPYFTNNVVGNQNQIYTEEALEKIHKWSCEFAERILISKYQQETIVKSSTIADIEVTDKDGNSKFYFVFGRTPLQQGFIIKAQKLSELLKCYYTGKTISILLIHNAGTQEALLVEIKDVTDVFLERFIKNLKGDVWFECIIV